MVLCRKGIVLKRGKSNQIPVNQLRKSSHKGELNLKNLANIIEIFVKNILGTRIGQWQMFQNPRARNLSRDPPRPSEGNQSCAPITSGGIFEGFRGPWVSERHVSILWETEVMVFWAKMAMLRLTKPRAASMGLKTLWTQPERSSVGFQMWGWTFNRLVSIRTRNRTPVDIECPLYIDRYKVQATEKSI